MVKLQKNKSNFTKTLKVKKKINVIANKTKKNMENNGKSKKQYSKMSFDDFLTEGLDKLGSGSDSEESNELIYSNFSSEGEIENQVSDEEISYDNTEQDRYGSSEEEQIEEDSNQSETDDEISHHKESLAKLKDTDPEFYKFLEENDKKLLDFNLSDSDNDGKGVEENEDDLDDKTHKPPDELEVASDESDFEDETKHKDESVVTLKMLKSWQKDIQTDKSNSTIIKVIKAFHAAILRVANEEKEVVEYKVEGSSIFNGVIQICVLELGPAVRKYLRIAPGSKLPPHKCKRFVKIKTSLKVYFTDLLKLLNSVTSTNILTILLKHLHYMSNMIVSYGNVLKKLLKKLIQLWGTAEETVRVIAFFCILRMINNQQQNNLDMVLKSMYMTYVQNSKFVSPSTLPMINFMRRSLVEMFALDVNIAYEHVFLYIRQLAINLRSAITMKKKETQQAVYNWQFINSLRLWANLLSVSNTKSQLQPLIYPFVQVCLGTINLIPTTQYYPLRFHVTETLIEFSNTANVFIPILPFLVEILTSYDFNKKHQKVSMKPLQFLCILRLSKSQLQENGFKDTVIDTIYSQVLEYLSNQSSSIAFPDLSLFCVIQLKAFLKKCSVAAYTRKMKQLLEKIEQNSKFITSERKNATFNLSDTKQIEAWGTTIKNKGTPLSTYFESWRKMKNQKKNKEATNNEVLGNYELPVLKKVKKAGEQSSGPVELFPSDSSDSENESEVVVKRKRGKRGGKNVNKKPIEVTIDKDVNDDNVEDIVEDLKVTDW